MDSDNNPARIELTEQEAQDLRAAQEAQEELNKAQQAIQREGASMQEAERLQKEAEDAIRDETPHLQFAKGYPSMLRETAAEVVRVAQEALKDISLFFQSDTYQAVKESLISVTSFLDQHKEEIAALAAVTEEIRNLAPFLEMELEELRAENPDFETWTLPDLLEQGFDADGNPTDSPFRQLIDKAKARKAAFEETEEAIAEIEQAAEELPRIISNPADLVNYPLDKPNAYIWNLLASADPNGQIALDIDTTSEKDRKKGKEAIIKFGLLFDEEAMDNVRLTKQLTPFDKRVYIAAAALHNAGNHIMTATQIHKMMGNRRQPKTEQLEKIHASLNKMRAATVYIDTSKEVQVNKGYSKFVYDGSLIEFRRISAYINNTWTDAAIMLLAEPPLITFAKNRRQITAVPRLLLESPVSKTNANLMIDDYLIERISHMKNNPKLSRKMLFSKIYERCQVKTKLQRSRAPEKIRRYLDYYQQCGFINGYSEDKDGVSIQV